MASSGFSVNNHDRNDVVAFWQAVYQASEGYEKRIDWDGNYSGKNGTISAAFVDDVERRLNYFRAMCGVHSNVSVSANSTVIIDLADAFKPAESTLRSTASQDAALMLVRNYDPRTGSAPALTHFPPSHLTGWSPAAWNANSKGNFAFGLYGPGAITEYMVEQLSSSTLTSVWNSSVGHRRWNLLPNATKFATGDQPGSSAEKPPTNVFYVVQKPSEMLQELPGFVAYPPAGYFPVTINSPFWSLSHEGADFAFATVKMTDSKGNYVPISSIQRSDQYGDPAIIWHVDPKVNVRSVSRDTTYEVKVSGIGGEGIPDSFTYSVTLINPDLLTCDQKIAGTPAMAANGNSVYSFAGCEGAEGLQIVASRKSSARWKEDAENPNQSAIIGGTTGNYPLVVKTSSLWSAVAGSRSFRLTFPTSYDLVRRGVPDQSFELGREIIANANAKLQFQFRRGYMTRGTTLVVERSGDGGVTWRAVGNPIKGVNDTQFDSTVSSVSLALPRSTVPIRLRFRYFTKGGAIYTHEAAPNAPTGIYIDEIVTSGCDWLEQKNTTGVPATGTQFIFKSSTAGAKLAAGDEWQLRLRTKLGGKWFPPGPSKVVKITGQ